MLDTHWKCDPRCVKRRHITRNAISDRAKSGEKDSELSMLPSGTSLYFGPQPVRYLTIRISPLPPKLDFQGTLLNNPFLFESLLYWLQTSFKLLGAWLAVILSELLSPDSSGLCMKTFKGGMDVAVWCTNWQNVILLSSNVSKICQTDSIFIRIELVWNLSQKYYLPLKIPLLFSAQMVLIFLIAYR